MDFWTLLDFSIFHFFDFFTFFKMYFVHESDVFVFKMHHILHAQNYDHFLRFPPALGIQGLQKLMFLMISLFRFFPIFWIFHFLEFFDWWILEQMVNCHCSCFFKNRLGANLCSKVRFWSDFRFSRVSKIDSRGSIFARKGAAPGPLCGPPGVSARGSLPTCSTP